MTPPEFSDGGVSPLPEPHVLSWSGWTSQYFIIIPMSQIKYYNHDPMSRMIHRAILTGLGDFDRNTFPPIVESWSNPVSMCVKLSCTKKAFDGIRAEILSIYTTFGGSKEMLLCYQTSEAMQ